MSINNTVYYENNEGLIYVNQLKRLRILNIIFMTNYKWV